MATKEADRLNGDINYSGNITFLGAVKLPAAVDDAAVKVGAGISADKVQQKIWGKYSRSGNAASETIPLHVVRGATGIVVDVVAGYVAAPTGSGNVTIDIQKGGVTILSGNITLDALSGNRTPIAGVLAGGNVSSLVAGNWLDAVITANAGNGTVPSGLFIELRAKEDPN